MVFSKRRLFRHYAKGAADGSSLIRVAEERHPGQGGELPGSLKRRRAAGTWLAALLVAALALPATAATAATAICLRSLTTFRS